MHYLSWQHDVVKRGKQLLFSVEYDMFSTSKLGYFKIAEKLLKFKRRGNPIPLKSVDNRYIKDNKQTNKHNYYNRWRRKGCRAFTGHLEEQTLRILNPAENALKCAPVQSNIRVVYVQMS